MKRLLNGTALAALALATHANAGELRSMDFQTTTLQANDDQSSSAVDLGFNVSFRGYQGSQVYVNNNGNLTFGSSLVTFTPNPIGTETSRIIAPFWADVDTRGTGTVTYGRTTIDGRTAFVATWNEVGYFSMGTDKRNTFQVVLKARPDIGRDAFEIEFNYRSIQWESGGASGGVNGLGGSTARAGFAGHEIAGSGQAGAFLDSNQNGLANRGRLIFFANSGELVLVDNLPPAPEVPLTAAIHEEAIQAINAQTMSANLRRVVSAIGDRLMAVNMQQRGRGQVAQIGRQTGMSSGDAPLGIAAWASTSGSYVSDTGTAQPFSGSTFTGMLGIDKTYGKSLVVGLAFTGEDSETDFHRISGGTGSNGATGVFYGAYSFNDIFSLQGQIGYGHLWSSIEETRTTRVTGEYDGNRFLANVSANAVTSVDQWLLTGRVGVSHARENYDSYVASDGSRVSPPETRVNQMRISGQAAYDLDKWQPYTTVAWEWDFDRSDNSDPTGGFVEAGLTYYLTDQVSLGGYLSAQFLREKQEDYSIGVNMRYAF